MNWISIAAVNLACAVGFGAFGAHGLKARVTAEQLTWWHTGTQYFFYHALGLLLVGILIKQFSISHVPAYFLQVGIILFVGSLYAMTFGAPRWFGAITPIGGVCMILGWLSLAWVCRTQ